MANQDPQNNNGYSWKKILGGLGAAGVLTFLFTMSQNNWELPFGKTDPALSGDDPSQMVVTNSAPKNQSDEPPKKLPTVSWSKFEEMVESHGVTKVLQSTDQNHPEIIFQTDTNSLPIRVVPPPQENLRRWFKANNVSVQYDTPRTPQEMSGGASSGGSLLNQIKNMSLSEKIFASFFLLLIAQMGYRAYQDRKGSHSPMGGFGKSKAKVLEGGNIPDITFADVKGQDEAKQDVIEYLDFLKKADKFEALGGKMPKGALMVGPPGTGKTLLARALAGEAGIPFFSTSGSEFIEMFVGVGASRIRDMFAAAEKKAPCIIFIDEIDAIGRHRQQHGGAGAGNDEREQALNQLLVEMDGFQKNGIIVIAATNRPDILDPALRRAGRFDREIAVGLPDLKGREEILQLYVDKRPNGKPMPLADDVNLKDVAKATPGFAPASLEALVNEAAIFAGRKDKTQVDKEAFREARDKVMIGAARKTAMTDEEKWNTAYHEAAHAIVGAKLHDDRKVERVSILPRGQALGITFFLNENDRMSVSRSFVNKEIPTLLAGRLGEEFGLGADNVTGGATNDIERATDLAWKYNARWGLSEKLGPINFGTEEGHSAFLKFSESMKQELERTVKEQIDSCNKTARMILKQNEHILHDIAQKLVEEETIDGEVIYKALGLEMPADRPKNTTPPWEAYHAKKAANGNASAPNSGVA